MLIVNILNVERGAAETASIKLVCFIWAFLSLFIMTSTNHVIQPLSIVGSGGKVRLEVAFADFL